jgi:hypothetical protein
VKDLNVSPSMPNGCGSERCPGTSDVQAMNDVLLLIVVEGARLGSRIESSRRNSTKLTPVTRKVIKAHKYARCMSYDVVSTPPSN